MLLFRTVFGTFTNILRTNRPDGDGRMVLIWATPIFSLRELV